MRRTISTIILIFSVPVFFISLRAGEKKRVAVMDFTANNTTEAYARIVRNQIEVSLYKTGLFEILERDKMELILKEQGLQVSGCTDTVCAVEIGKLLSVHYVMVGSLDKLGMYLISIKFIDIRKGVVTYADSAGAENDNAIPAALNKLAGDAAVRLAGGSVIDVKLPGDKPERTKTAGSDGKSIDNPYAWPALGLFSVGAISFGGGYYYNMRITAANADYNDLADRYNASTDVNEATSLGTEMSQLEEDLSKYRLYRNIAYGAGAASFLAAGYFIYKYFTYKPPLSTDPVKSGSLIIMPVLYSGFTAVDPVNCKNRYFFGGGILIRF